ncbi:TPA: hypothetical protein SIA31_000014 [Aeromonas sobria]|nr:hypothetical protein [Aeromonas sobria]
MKTKISTITPKAFKDYFSANTLFVNAKHINVATESGKSVHTYNINKVCIMNNDTNSKNYMSEKLTEKQIGKLLTSAGYPAKKDGKDDLFGRAIRTAVKRVFKDHLHGLEQEAYAFVDCSGDAVKIWIADVSFYDSMYRGHGNDSVQGSVFCIYCKDGDRAECNIFQEILCESNGRQGRKNPFIKGTTMTHHLKNMLKIETRGRPEKVKAVVTETSTLVENNVATIELIEKYNDTVDVIIDTADEVISLKAELEKMKADMEKMQAELSRKLDSELINL